MRSLESPMHPLANGLKRRYHVSLAAMVVLTATLLGLWVFSSERLRTQQRLSHLQDIGSTLSEQLSSSIHDTTLALYGIGELALEYDGPVASLAALARNMRAGNPQLMTVSILPDGVVQQIEPLADHRDALGHSPFKEPDQAAEAERARESRRLTVSGPYTLKSNVEGLIARLPLYKGDRFWGFASIAYRFPSLIDDLLARYAEQDLVFQIQTRPTGPVILGNTERMPDQHFHTTVALPNNQWFLTLAYRASFNWLLITKLAVALLTLLISGYIYHRLLTSIITQHRLQNILHHNDQLREHHSAHQRMLAQISHDLRAPMQHLLHELRQIEASAYQIQHPAQVMEQNVRYQLDLLDQLLNYCTGPERIQSATPEPGYTYHFLHQIGDQAHSLVHAWGNCFQLNVPVDLPAVIETDFHLLQRILINLLSNAAKFTQSGTVTLSVSALPSATADHRLRFHVQDEGTGLPASNARGQHPNSGHGLGLTIVTELLQLLGSTLEYQQLNQGGSDFHFDLDLALPQQVPDPYQERYLPDWDGEGLSILLVDPDPVATESLAELLLSYGVNLLITCCLTDARQILRNTSVDLVITDCSLPDGEGYELIQPAGVCGQQVPVMLYGSRPSTAASAQGFAAILLRPAGSDLLLKQIRLLTAAVQNQ